MITNQFFRGVDRDTAPDGVASDRARDARNLRLTTIGGQGMIMTSLQGNTQTFQLSDGFLPLGHATFQGISIIFSANPSTGEGEIGSFPSPAVGGGFNRTYTPLQNFTGTVDPRIDPNATRLPFRSTCLNFQCDKQIDATARISYDGSIEVFWTDFNNQLRHLSSGFRADTGEDTSRLYWHGNDGSGNQVCSSLLNLINVFFESCGRPVENGVISLDGGSLEAGNWFFYPRYVRTELSSTSFLSRIGPVQISTDDPPQGPVISGDEEGTNTGKKVRITLDNIDSGFQFIEIGFSHHHGTTFDTGLVNKLFPIPPGATSITIEVTGDEGVIDLTSAEITADKSSDDTVRSIAQVENILWGGNWKGSSDLVKLMRPIALQVVGSAPDPGDLLLLPDWKVGDPGIAIQNQDYVNTLDNVGYFRGEPYATAVVFVTNSGKSLPPLPITGTDHWTGSPNPTNQNGVVRFYSGDTAGYEIFDNTGVKVMGIQFDTSAATIPPELFNQICGFYFVRAERKPQLIYQGLGSNVWSVYEDPEAIETNAADNPYNPSVAFDIRVNKYIAEFRGENADEYMDVPFRLFEGGVDMAGVYNASVTNVVDGAINKAGIFSADHFFLKNFTDGTYHLRVQGEVNVRNTAMSADFKPSNLWEADDMTPGGSAYDDISVVNVADNTPSTTPLGLFVSRFEEGNTENTGGNLWFRVWHPTPTWETGNREVRQRNYLGVISSSAGADFGQSGRTNAKLINVYRFDPIGTNVGELYDPGVELYYRISDFRPISDWGGVFIEYHGDCFLQRTYFKQTCDSGFHEASETRVAPPGPSPIPALRSAYGNLIGFVSENVVNTAMRYGLGNQQFFPGSGADILDALTHSAQRNDYLESDYLNRGYDRTIDIKGVLGYDVNVPFGTGFNPTRIRYSNRYVNDTTTRDGYLSWGLDNYKDFDHHPGEIMAIAALGGNLYSIQRHAMRRHYITERYLNQGVNGAQFILGDGDTLSDRSSVISGEMGTQHQWSVVKTDNAIYGVDFSLRSAWRFASDGFSLLSETRLFHSDVYDSVEVRSGTFSDSSVISGDAPVCNEGIVGWYDRKHREMGWSFLWDLGSSRYSETIVYDEKSNAYMGKRYGESRSHSPYYLTINEDMYSLDPAAAPWSPGSSQPSFWIHDSNLLHTNFWGFQEIAQLQAVVNPSSNMVKIYDHARLAGSDTAMREVNFRTEFQISSLNPFIGNPLFWLEPRYQENVWNFTIPKTVTIIPGPNQEYQPSSPLRGKWMQAEFIWESTLPITVRSLNTYLRESLQ